MRKLVFLVGIFVVFPTLETLPLDEKWRQGLIGLFALLGALTGYSIWAASIGRSSQDATKQNQLNSLAEEVLGVGKNIRSALEAYAWRESVTERGAMVNQILTCADKLDELAKKMNEGPNRPKNA